MRRTAADKPVVNAEPKRKSLAQAQSDFTAEGSPLPGLVAAGERPVQKATKTSKPRSVKANA